MQAILPEGMTKVCATPSARTGAFSMCCVSVWLRFPLSVPGPSGVGPLAATAAAAESRTAQAATEKRIENSRSGRADNRNRQPLRQGPRLTMLALEIEDAEIWASTGSKLKFGWEIAKANFN